jgi:hypothetical protein
VPGLIEYDGVNLWMTNDVGVRSQVNGGGYTPTGHDGYAVIEVGGVGAFRPIKSSYVTAAFGITGFAGPTAREVGQTLASPGFAAAYNDVPTAASVVDDQGNPSEDVTATPNTFSYLHSYTKTANGATVGFTLSASKGTEGDSRGQSVAWQPRAYRGVGVAGLHTEADIKALAHTALQSDRTITFTESPGASQYIYYAYPAVYGAATFFVDGWEGGFDLVDAAVSVTNAYGVTQDYRLYKSTNANLGTTTVQVE